MRVIHGPQRKQFIAAIEATKIVDYYKGIPHKMEHLARITGEKCVPERIRRWAMLGEIAGLHLTSMSACPLAELNLSERS